MLSLNDKNELEEKIIDEMFERVLRSKPKNEDIFTSYIFKKLEEIFKIEVEYLGLHYSKSNSKKNNIAFSIQEKKNNNITGDFQFLSDIPCVIIYSKHKNYYDILSEDAETRIRGVRSFLKTLFHELRHLKQYLLTQQNVSNKNVLRNAKEFLLLGFRSPTIDKIYKDHHDDFAIEADAIIKSYDKVNNLTRESFQIVDDIYNLKIHESNRDFSYIVSGNNVYNRDAFFNYSIDFYIKTDKKNEFFKKMPILLKEYNPDGSKVSLSDLITNMKNELLVALFIRDDDNKSQIINDIYELYYELIYKRLELEDPFELYEAINNHSRDEIKALIIDIKAYFSKEKKHLLRLLKDKCDNESKKNNNPDAKIHDPFNKGKIKIKKLNSIELINTDSYAYKLDSKDNNPVKNILYSSKAFRQRLPNYGYYYLKNGTKISVNAFVDNIFLKEYDKMNSKGNIPLKYNHVLFKYVKSPYETEFLHNCEVVNKDSQIKDRLLDKTLKLPLLTKTTNNINDEIFELMKIVKEILNPDVLNNLCNYMLSKLEYTDDGYYYSFNYDQISYFDMLLKASKLLNTNPFLNPNKKDYYRLFRECQVIKDINNEINKYFKITNNHIIRR